VLSDLARAEERVPEQHVDVHFDATATGDHDH
jgi:hypothetical protein